MLSTDARKRLIQGLALGVPAKSRHGDVIALNALVNEQTAAEKEADELKRFCSAVEGVIQQGDAFCIAFNPRGLEEHLGIPKSRAQFLAKGFEIGM